jgi:hypothetical protein
MLAECGLFTGGGPHSLSISAVGEHRLVRMRRRGAEDIVRLITPDQLQEERS